MVLKFTSKVNFNDDSMQINGDVTESASLGIKDSIKIPNKNKLIDTLKKLAQKIN